MRQSSSEILLEMESDCTQSLSLINKYSLTPSGSLIVVICLVTNGSFLPVSDNRDNFCFYIFKELLVSKRGSHREWFCTATCKASENCVAIRLNTYHTRGNHQKHSHSTFQLPTVRLSRCISFLVRNLANRQSILLNCILIVQNRQRERNKSSKGAFCVSVALILCSPLSPSQLLLPCQTRCRQTPNALKLLDFVVVLNDFPAKGGSILRLSYSFGKYLTTASY